MSHVVNYHVLSHDLRLHSNMVLKVLAGTPEKTIPLRHTCRYYRTWKPLRDTLICQKHTTFAMIIHHATARVLILSFSGVDNSPNSLLLGFLMRL